jgi:2-amino-4-hydroxy-6-hydroxymethyldihydropteridine diphosphokinase
MSRLPQTVYLAFGANLGDRTTTIDRAIAMLQEHDAIDVDIVSAYHETDPVGGPAGQPKYLNAVARISTTLDPFALLAYVQHIESILGRIRSVPNAARTIDIDILFFGDESYSTPELTVPHPRMFERDFVMIPLREVYDGKI